jgi:apolipoprotein D and lipocalin family protein
MIKAAGVARVIGKGPDSILKVRFAPAFLSFIPQVWGDYQVIGPLAGLHAGRRRRSCPKISLDTLSLAQIDDAKYVQLWNGARGFDVARLQKTRQM